MKPSKQPPVVRPIGEATPEEINRLFDEAREQARVFAESLRRMCTPTADDLAMRVR